MGIHLGNRIALGAIAGLALLAGGCAGDPRPKYVAPPLADAQVATLKAEGGMFIDGVDGARIDEMSFNLLGTGGNTVKVAPGERALSITRQSGNSMARWNVKYTFQAGRVYTIGPDNWIAGSNIKLTDQTTKTSTILR
jgi:hypothetical protein